MESSTQRPQRAQRTRDWGDCAANVLTEEIIRCAIEVHRRIGPGLLESAYEACLCHELTKSGVRFQRQVAVPLVYDDVKVDCGFRCDILVENRVVIELKAKEQFHPIDSAQLLSYLRILKLEVGLLLNFHTKILTDGIKRVSNGFRG